MQLVQLVEFKQLSHNNWQDKHFFKLIEEYVFTGHVSIQVLFDK
jgi:hypothetical protein